MIKLSSRLNLIELFRYRLQKSYYVQLIHYLHVFASSAFLYVILSTQFMSAGCMAALEAEHYLQEIGAQEGKSDWSSKSMLERSQRTWIEQVTSNKENYIGKYRLCSYTLTIKVSFVWYLNHHLLLLPIRIQYLWSIIINSILELHILHICRLLCMLFVS